MLLRLSILMALRRETNEVMLITVLLVVLCNASNSEAQPHFPSEQQSMLSFPSLLTSITLLWQKVIKQIQHPIAKIMLLNELRNTHHQDHHVWYIPHCN